MIKLYIFDLDGTLYRGDDPIPAAVACLERLRKDGKQVRFLTNNSGRAPEDLASKLQRMGIEAHRSEIYTSALGAAKYCREQGFSDVFLVGEQGLHAAFSEFDQTTEPQAVVAGICRHFTYDLCNDALQHLLRGAVFIATNRDATYPLEGGRVEPGAGAIIGALAACSGSEPIVMGKPNPYLIDLIVEEAEVAAQEALVVGDRYETDIQAGLSAGCQTLLVLTGVTPSPPPGQPFMDSLAEFHD